MSEPTKYTMTITPEALAALQAINEEHAKTYILVVGNPSDGFTCYGPFERDAVEDGGPLADTLRNLLMEVQEDDWRVMPLRPLGPQ